MYTEVVWLGWSRNGAEHYMEDGKKCTVHLSYNIPVYSTIQDVNT